MRKIVWSILLPFVAVSGVIPLASCGAKSDDNVTNISSSIFEPYDSTIYFVSPVDHAGHGPSNVQEIDLLSINNDILANNLVLDYFHANISSKITYDDFFMVNDAVTGGAKYSIDYSIKQRIKLTVYAEKNSKLLTGSFSFFCLVCAIDEPKSVERIFSDLTFDESLNVEVNNKDFFDAKEIANSVNNDSYLQNVFLEKVAGKADYINSINLDLNCKEDDVTDEQLSLTLTARGDTICQNRIIRNSVFFTHSTGTKMSVKYNLVNEVFDIGSAGSGTVEPLAINSKNPYTVGAEELLKTLTATLKKSQYIEKKIMDANPNKKHILDWTNLSFSINNMQQIFDLTTPKEIIFSATAQSTTNFYKGSVSTAFEVTASDISLELSQLRIDDLPEFGIDANEPSMVKLSEIASLSYNSNLINLVYDKINKSAPGKISYGEDFYIGFYYQTGDYSKGKLTYITVIANEKSMNLKGRFQFTALVFVNKNKYDISATKVKIDQTIKFFSATPNYVTDLRELDTINTNEILTKGVTTALAISHPNIQTRDFTITNSAKLGDNYGYERTIEITCTASQTSFQVLGSFKFDIKILATLEVVDLSVLTFLDSSIFSIEVNDPANVTFGELQSALQSSSDLRTTIFTEVKKWSSLADFGIDFDYRTASTQKDFSNPVDIEIIIEAKVDSVYLKNSKKQIFKFMGRNSPAPEKMKYNASFSGVGSRKLVQDVYLASKDGKEKLDCSLEIDTIDIEVPIIRNKLWNLYGQKEVTLFDLINSGAIEVATAPPMLALNGGFFYCRRSETGKVFAPVSVDDPYLYNGSDRLNPQAIGKYTNGSTEYTFGAGIDNLMSLFTYEISFDYSISGGKYVYTPRLHSKLVNDSTKNKYRVYFWTVDDDAEVQKQENWITPSSTPKVEWETK